MKLRPLFAGLATCSGLAVASTASAAPAMPCAPATMTPIATSVPANLPAFAYSATNATAGDVHLTALSATAPAGDVPLTIGPVAEGHLKVAPTKPLVAGTSYRLEYQSFCGYGPYPSKPLEFTATAEAPLPTQLGALTSGPTVTLKDYGSTQVAITAGYSVVDEMKPWAHLYQINVAFDGKLVETKSTWSSALDSVQIEAKGWCDQASAATTKHTIQLRGRLPFAPTVETLAANMDFVCPPPSISPPPNNAAVPPTSTSSSSGATGTGTGTPTTTIHGGCSATPGATSSSASIALLFGLAALVRRRVSGASAAKRRT